MMDFEIPSLNGLILIGGKSSRMGSDKSLLHYHGESQRSWLMKMLAPYCGRVFWSVNAQQSLEIEDPESIITDIYPNFGPMGGLLSAFHYYPHSAWLVVACDFPYLDTETLAYLIENRKPDTLATTFLSNDGLPQPLVGIYEPSAYPLLQHYHAQQNPSLRHFLQSHPTTHLVAPNIQKLQNQNTPL